MADKPTDPGRQTADELLSRGIDAVPEGSFKQFLKQAGWVGLALAVLIGNVPWTFAVKSALERKAPVSLETLETYWIVLVLFTPFVVLFGVLVYLIRTETVPTNNGPLLLIGAGLLWWVATLVSFSLGGTVPPASMRPPTGPSAVLDYIFSSIGTYVDHYGPVPVFAGPVEGAAFGYWASVLSRTT